MAGDVEHVLMDLFAICISSWVTHPFMRFAHSLTGLFVLYRLTLRVFNIFGYYFFVKDVVSKTCFSGL